MYDVALRMADAVYHQRTRLGLSQRELAERADVSRHTVVNIEAGRTGGIRLDTLYKVFDALGLQISVFPKQELPSRPSEDAAAARERFRSRFTAGGDELAVLKARG
ncbi:MAG: helix-turn-helix domain-containing protein [Atopobiaceae bacterium]|nr:helix-turn-helix domain-containing protein [Atopobiaceae bacterium]